MPKDKKIEISLEYQNYIQNPPVAPKDLYRTAAGSDDITVDKLGPTWVKNVRENHAKFGAFSAMSIGQLWGQYRHKPAIIAGSGPSLKRNGPELKERDGIPLISCLHNFHFFVDHGVDVDYYVTLDAGEVTVEEVYEGGKESPEFYWAATKEKTLLAYIGTSPRLLAKWQGKIYFFNAPVPGHAVDQEITAIDPFHIYVSSGGNVLGACLYIAKAIMGANPIAFVGADFCFSYEKKFHGWDSKYDINIGQVLRTVDVFGNKVFTWGSYHGFKCFFDWVSQTVPGVYFNCSEGGTFGAYTDGNIMSVRQLDLCDFLRMYQLCQELKECCEKPTTAERKVLY
jgi:hypothetical protein